MINYSSNLLETLFKLDDSRHSFYETGARAFEPTYNLWFIEFYASSDAVDELKELGFRLETTSDMHLDILGVWTLGQIVIYITSDLEKRIKVQEAFKTLNINPDSKDWSRALNYDLRSEVRKEFNE